MPRALLVCRSTINIPARRPAAPTPRRLFPVIPELPTERAGSLRVKCGLFLRGGKCPCGAGAALLAKDEAQLLGRSQLGLIGTERRAGLRKIERAEEVAPEVAFLAAHLGGDLLALPSLHLPHPLPRVDERNGRDQSIARAAAQGKLWPHSANRRENRRRGLEAAEDLCPMRIGARRGAERPLRPQPKRRRHDLCRCGSSSRERAASSARA
jgi:hypothetical protein